MAASLHPAAVVATFPGAPCLGIVVDRGRLRRIDLLPAVAERGRLPDPDPSGTPLLDDVLAALAAYFGAVDTSQLTALPLAAAPTPFAARVRQALLGIPPGRTRTYGDLARELGTSARAIGGACRGNPLPVVVPCHRIVGATGAGGYAGATDGPLRAFKLALLEHEARAHPTGPAR